VFPRETQFVREEAPPNEHVRELLQAYTDLQGARRIAAVDRLGAAGRTRDPGAVEDPALFANLYPSRSRDVGGEPVANHAVRSSGAYLIERRAFSAAGDHPPTEIQIDLVVRAVALLIPVWIALVLGLLAGVVSNTGAQVALGVGAALIALLAIDAVVGCGVRKFAGLTDFTHPTATRVTVAPRLARESPAIVISRSYVASVAKFRCVCGDHQYERRDSESGGVVRAFGR
jgi:hypothetical protein